MRIVITGGLGFIGLNLAGYIRRNHPGTSLIAIDWNENSLTAGQTIFDQIYNCCFVCPEALPAYRDADVIVHLAGCSTVQESITDPTFCHENNVNRTHVLLEHLRQDKISAKLIFASTGGAIVGNKETPIRESDPPNPLSPYGATKLAVEGMLAAYAATYGMNNTSLRFANVYGPNSACHQGVVARFCRACLGDGVLRVNGDGHQSRDFIHARDVSRAVMSVISEDARGIYNIGTGIGTSVRDLAALFQKIAGDFSARVRIEHAPMLPGEVLHNVCDITRIRNRCSFRPLIDLETGIRQTLEWFRTGTAGRTAINAVVAE